MAELKILDIIRKDAEYTLKGIQEKRNSEAEAIHEKAESTSDKLLKEAQLKIQGEVGFLLERKYNTIRHLTNARRYELKSSALENIWREAEKNLEKIVNSSGYKDILRSLFFESLPDVPDGSVVKASADDEEIIKGCIKESKRNVIFEKDPYVRGGVVVYWPDGKIVLKNTLFHRLKRFKEEGNSEIAAILFASDEVSQT